LTARKVVGLVMAMVGVAVLVGLDLIPLSGVVLLSVGASLLAALCYALAGVYAKRMFSDVPALALGIGRQAGTAILYPWPPPAYPERQRPSRSCSPCWDWLCSRRRTPTCSTSASSPTSGPRRP
jgi:drug/metabolite transporter (DMT)-like permease